MEKRTFKNWWLSLSFLIGYVGVFGVWTQWTRRDAIIASTTVVVILGIVAVVKGVRDRYFFNRSELFAYACIPLDVIAEAVLSLRLIEGETDPPKPHFWLCAAAFSLVLGGYRYFRLCKKERGD